MHVVSVLKRIGSAVCVVVRLCIEGEMEERNKGPRLVVLVYKQVEKLESELESGWTGIAGRIHVR